MHRFRWLVFALAITGAAFTPAMSRTVEPKAADSNLASLPDSLSLASATTFEDTLLVLERSLRAFAVLGDSLSGLDAGVFEELVAAMRDSYDTSDVEAASILSEDAWEIVRSRSR